MPTAAPQDTYDHTIGTGALTFSWWHNSTETGVDGADATPEWQVTLTADNGDGGETTKAFGHADVLKAARSVLASPPEYASGTLRRECRNLIFDAGEADFDAPAADELLQYIVLGEIVFG